jgi:hypothetical protein
MPPGPTAPRSLAGLLAEFRPCFTAPTFQTFIGLVVGLIAQTRRRTVCGMLTGAGLEQVWHHSRAHRLFTTARWSSDALGLALADLIVTHLLPAGSPLTVAVDDTLFKRSGKKVFGVAWHHDGAAKGPKPIGFGNCWVVAGIVVQLSFLSRPVCLPVLARLWRPRHTGKIAYARQLAELLAARYPDRAVQVVGDAAYVGERLRDVDARITWTSRLKVTSVLHELPPPRTGRSGRPRTRGARLGTPADVAALATTRNAWRATQVRRYGRTDAVQITERVCLWYGSFRSRTVRIILVRDTIRPALILGVGEPAHRAGVPSAATDPSAASGHAGQGDQALDLWSCPRSAGCAAVTAPTYGASDGVVLLGVAVVVSAVVSAAEGEIPQGGELGLDPASIQFRQSSRTGSALVCRSMGMPGSPGRELSAVLCW